MPDPNFQLSTANYVRAVLDEFGHAVAAQDVDAVLRVLTDDAIVIGSGAGERAFGRAEIVPFLKRVFAEFGSIRWEWDEWSTREAGSEAWFFVEGRVVAGDEIGPYRASGVCHRDDVGEWKLALFHGSTPDG